MKRKGQALAIIGIIATLDTKGKETKYLKERIESKGGETLVIDVGVLNEPNRIEPDISRSKVVEAAGITLEALIHKVANEKVDRIEAIETMGRGAANVVSRLHKQKALDGLIAIGGAQGTNIATTAMRCLPFGIPKLMVTTIAAAPDIGKFVGTKDITIYHSVADIVDSSIIRRVLDNAAGAITGMSETFSAKAKQVKQKKQITIAATMLGTTSDGVLKAKEILESKLNCEVVIFHPNGTGGRAMEEMISECHFDAVLDLTTVELREQVVGGKYAAEGRLKSAGQKGIPQVVSIGGMDQIQCGPPETLPQKYRNRKTHQHNPKTTTVRANSNEMRKTAQIMARRLTAAKGAVLFLYPQKGISAVDKEGRPLFDLEANEAFLKVFEECSHPSVEIKKVSAHINDKSFAEAAADGILKLLSLT